MPEHWSWTPDETGLDDDTSCPLCGEDACERSCTAKVLADQAEDPP